MMFHILLTLAMRVFIAVLMDCVIVTGASTGIGYSSAEMLAKNGFHVLAGVRNLDDLVKVEDAHKNIKGFILDVAEPGSIQKALNEIKSTLDQAKRVSLVNNAGISMPGPLEGLKISDLRRQFDVNFFGLIELTQEVLPWIRKTQGKIINMSSISGLISSPFLGAYSASKYAVEAASDALRREMIRFGVEVILVEPGPVRTPIWSKGMEKKDQLQEILRPGMRELYEKELLRMSVRVERAVKNALPAEDVALVVLNCMSRSSNPARILVVNPNINLQVKLVRWLPTKLMDRAMAKFFYK